MFGFKGSSTENHKGGDQFQREAGGFKPFLKQNKAQIQAEIKPKLGMYNRSSSGIYSDSQNDLQYSSSQLSNLRGYSVPLQQQNHQNIQSNASYQTRNQPPSITPRRLEILTGNNSILRESSMIFMSKLHFKPFQYGRCSEKLNMPLLDNVNVEEIEFSQDPSRAQKLLRNIAFTNFDVELVEKMGYDNFSKILRLWQVSILNYGDRQKEEQSEGETLYTTYREHLEANQKIDEIKKSHADKKTSLYENLKSLQWQINELKSISNKQATFKCTYCEKLFPSKEETRKHIKSIHKDQIQEIKEERKVIEGLGNPIRTITRREEKMINQANEEIAQKVAKEMEEKMAIQFKQLFEAQQERQSEKDWNGNAGRAVERRNDMNESHLLGSVNKMNSVFGGFEEMFAQMQMKQQTLLEEQGQQNRRLEEIEQDQKRLEQEKEKQRKEMQDQIRLQQSQQQLRIDLTVSRNEDEDALTRTRQNQDDFYLNKDPSFGNQQLAVQRNAVLRTMKERARKGIDDEDDEADNYAKTQARRRGIFQEDLADGEQERGSEQKVHITAEQFYEGSDRFSSEKRIELKKQFKSKYMAGEALLQEEKRELRRVKHFGELESDYDSELMDESVEEGVLIPTNQHQLLRRAELEFKQKLMAEKEINEIQKNIAYKMAVIRKEAKSGDLQKQEKHNYIYDNNKSLSNFMPDEQERRKNERLIEEIIQMNERRMEVDYEPEQPQQFNLVSQQQDIVRMKKQFIKDNLQFDFHDDETDIMDFDEGQFAQLKQIYNQKFNPKQSSSAQN